MNLGDNVEFMREGKRYFTSNVYSLFLRAFSQGKRIMAAVLIFCETEFYLLLTMMRVWSVWVRYPDWYLLRWEYSNILPSLKDFDSLVKHHLL